MSQPSTKVNRHVIRYLLSVLTIAVCFGIWFAFFRSTHKDIPVVTLDQPSPDPRLAFETEFRNVKPHVKYVGDAECATCHREICNTYHNHPMGRSASLVDGIARPEKVDGKAYNPVRTESHDLQVFLSGKTVSHRMTATTPPSVHVPPYEVPIKVAIGSGTRGRSYLSVDSDAVWQSPLSWFTDDDRWNVSPGFQLGNGMQRPVPADCLFCHVDRVEPVAKSKNRFVNPFGGQLSIGCERCHGPGELHVTERLAQDAPVGRDTSIVNPKHLDVELQKDICRQCHLIGENRVTHFGRSLYDYRPGIPLAHVVSLFVAHPDFAKGQKSVSQFEQMERSGCYVRGGGQMTCTSCHNPHASPAQEQKGDFYRSRCLTCHADRGCNQPMAVRQTKNDSCIACHMPRRDSSNIAHAAVTDHMIPRLANKESNSTPANSKPGNSPIVAYQSGKYSPNPQDAERDFGIALAKKLQSLRLGRQEMQSLAMNAKDRLTNAIKDGQADEQALLSLASISAMFGDTEGRLNAAKRAVVIAPDSEEALALLTVTYVYAKQFDEALTLADRLVKMVPSAIDHRLLRANVLIGKRDWIAAEKACRDAQAINSLSAESHILRAMCLDALGKADEAKKEADTAFALETNPDVQRQYRTWYRPKR